jgi:tetratricopeptide (TPR) repeat protein
LAKAKQAIEQALRISPNNPEAHLVFGRYFVQGVEQAAAGEKELNIAASALPGRADIYNWRARVEEEQGKWKEALRDRERAIELDPRDAGTAKDLVQLYIVLRRYEAAERLVDHMIAILPKQPADNFWRKKSNIALARGDLNSALAALEANPLKDAGIFDLDYIRGCAFTINRDYTKAEKTFGAIIETAKAHNAFPTAGETGNELFWRAMHIENLGRIARYRGEKEKARGYFEAARQNLVEFLARDSGMSHWRTAHAPAYIAEIDAALGRSEDAIREGRESCEHWPLSRDARIAPDIAILLAIDYMWTGQRDAALKQLAEVAKLPVWPSLYAMCPGLSAGELKLNPLWDELRNDPRFDKIVAEAAKPVKIE